MSEPFLGEIRMFAGNFAPRGWALCNGQMLAISTNTALFSILGTTYGGNGTTTFGLPDLRSRVPVHAGQGAGLSNYVLGEQTGVENVTLLQGQMPSHNHMVAANAAASATSPAGAVLANDARNPSNIYAASGDGTTMNPQMIALSGGSQPHANLQPVLCVNFIIALNGIFPSRN